MTLEYERLLNQITSMVDAALSRQQKLSEQKVDIAARFHDYAGDRDTIERCLVRALEQTGKLYAARPHSAYADELLNAGVPAPDCPDTAVIIGADGSQILPDRHAPFLYYLINIGLITYYHGTARAPDTATRPTSPKPSTRVCVPITGSTRCTDPRRLPTTHDSRPGIQRTQVASSTGGATTASSPPRSCR